MDAKWRLEFNDPSTSGSTPPTNPPGYISLKELGVRPLTPTLALVKLYLCSGFSSRTEGL